MNDQKKTKAQLVAELEKLRRKVVRLEKAATKHKHAEDALRESQEHFRLLYERSPLGYQSLDANGCFIEVNPAWLELLGYSREHVIGRWFGDFVAPEYVDKFRQNFPRFQAAGEIHGIEFELVRQDGSHLIAAFDGTIGHDAEGNFYSPLNCSNSQSCTSR